MTLPFQWSQMRGQIHNKRLNFQKSLSPPTKCWKKLNNGYDVHEAHYQRYEMHAP